MKLSAIYKRLVVFGAFVCLVCSGPIAAVERFHRVTWKRDKNVPWSHPITQPNSTALLFFRFE